MPIKLIPVEPKKNKLIFSLEFMHGDGDAYTTKTFVVDIPAEKSERIGQILMFLSENLRRLNWKGHFRDNEYVENELKVDGYNMTFVIDGIRVSVEGTPDITTDGQCPAYGVLMNDVVYFDEESREFHVIDDLG